MSAADTYAGQLAQRVAELLPDLAMPGRLELLDVMDPDDMRSSLAFILSMYPQVFDFALVRDRAMVGRLQERVEERDEAEYLAEPEGYCTTCGENVAHFIGYEGPQHFRGPHKLVTGLERRELFDAGHAPVIGWRAPLVVAVARVAVVVDDTIDRHPDPVDDNVADTDNDKVADNVSVKVADNVSVPGGGE